MTQNENPQDPLVCENPQPVPISEEDFLRKIAKMYREHVYEDVGCHLERDFHYASFWVFSEMTSADEYVYYIERKTQAFRRARSVISAEIMYLKPGGGMFGEPAGKPFLVIQGGKSEPACLFVERSARGLIKRMDMMPKSFYDLAPEPADGQFRDLQGQG